MPWGLRTVDGSYNNLVPGQQFFGASGQPFPTIAGDPVFGNELDETPFFGISNTNYGADANVVDSDPRIISNLIVDQTITNPAAVQAFVEGGFGVLVGGVLHFANDDGTAGDIVPAGVTLTIPNTTPDEGLSAGFNTWFIFFGQFFDHGLDFIERDTEIVVIPLQPDDPLYVPGSPTNFMMIERTRKEDGAATNLTTPFVDQNQTYTSHASHQVFLREYVLDAAGHPVATGELIKGADGGMATWADVKQQAAEILGIDLTDLDVGRVPLVLTDEYGKFLPGANGLPQLVAMAGGVLEGDLTTLPPTLASAALAVPTGHAFIIDIAHSANPRSSTGVPLPADGNSAPGLANPVVLSNASFEANSMADGQPDVNVDPVLGNWALIDPQGWDVTGFAGVYAPTAAVVSATGHQGGNVVFLDGGATLVRNTGVLLQEGNAYTLTFNVGNRLDQETFVGGTAQFVTVDGDVLATVTLPTPVDGNWAAVTLSTGPIALAQAGEELRIEIIHAGASGSQVLIDNVQFRAEPTTTSCSTRTSSPATVASTRTSA